MTELPQLPEPDLPHLRGDSQYDWVPAGEIIWRLLEGWQFCGHVVGCWTHHGHWSAAMWRQA
jgi:hypothetical protein